MSTLKKATQTLGNFSLEENANKHVSHLNFCLWRVTQVLSFEMEVKESDVIHHNNVHSK